MRFWESLPRIGADPRPLSAAAARRGPIAFLCQAALAFACLLAAAAAAAQGPEADWRTLQTPRYRVHYPAPWEAWTLRAAARLESIRTRVEQEVGYAAPQRIDIVVMDPQADSNGSAWPFLRWPRMVLWTNPPPPDSVIGQFRDWGELLVTHEQTHLSHLLRPSRRRALRLLERTILPLGPIATGSPRWLIEGYATVIEGRLTGSGRPNGALRASILRRWAQAGALPSYAALSSDSSSFMGMSMAYLAGSAYLEWLERRAGQDSLRHLWARMTARAGRGFTQAFRGVYGDDPQVLYGRFKAELTAEAMEAERQMGQQPREGELWQRLRWSTGEPGVAPDGNSVVLVVREKDRPSRLLVWSTGPDTDEREAWAKSVRETLIRDPDDVAPVLAQPLPREPLYQLPTRSGAFPSSPRWLDGGRSVLYTRFEPDAGGFLHPDLFRWTPETGAVERLTRLADVRDADPALDGTWAAAVRNRHGFSQLVRVELASGAIEPLSEPSVESVYDRPRLSPDGARLACSRHAAGAWQLVVRPLGGGAERAMDTPPGSVVAQPAWSPDGLQLYAAVGSEGAIELWRFDVETGRGAPLTTMRGGAFAPAPTPDGKFVFFLSLEPHGFDLRRLELGPVPELSATSWPSSAVPESFVLAEVAPGRPYGVGRAELLPLLGGQYAASAHSTELGLRAGDLIGRLDVVLGAAMAPGGDGPRGAALAAAWRRWPWALFAHLYTATETPSRQPLPVDGLDSRLDLEQRGLELRTELLRRSRTSVLEISPGALFRNGQVLGSFQASVLRSSTSGFWRLRQRLAGHFEAGRTDGDAWARFGGELQLGLGFRGRGLGVSWRRDWAESASEDIDRLQLGGISSSILPASALSGRILVPALSAGTQIGERHEAQRAEIRLGPLPLFYQRHRLWDAGSKPGDWIELAGAELQLDLAPLPIVRAPGLELRLGFARIFGGPLEPRTTWWIGSAFRP